ncbi:MAG: CotH kinase family protein [Anaerolineaceae bacterium]|nr:CotH kinase family protein [Anaerolineaceae bacterium]
MRVKEKRTQITLFESLQGRHIFQLVRDESGHRRVIVSPFLLVLFVSVLLVGLLVVGVVLQQHGIPARAKNTLLGFISTTRQELNREVAVYRANGLNTVYLDIPFESLNQIEEKRQEALATGILLASDEDFVNAELTYGDDSPINIELRLKGDWTDHLGKAKWSYRVHVKDEDAAVLAMTRFSLQAPETRNYTDEWLLHQALFAEGLLTTRYHFVNVLINGEYMGIYALEESFSTEMLESHQRREGIILRFNEDQFWENRANFLEESFYVYKLGTIPGSFMLTVESNAEVSPFREGRIIDNPTLAAEYETAKGQMIAWQNGELTVDEVFDVEQVGKYFALIDLWGGTHAYHWHNFRYYYNPITTKFESIAYDNFVQDGGEYTSMEMTFPYWQMNLFDSPPVYRAYVDALESYTQPEFLNEIQTVFGGEMSAYQRAISQEYAINFPDPWEALRNRQAMLKTQLDPAQMARASYRRVVRDGRNYLAVDLVNMMTLPIELSVVKINNEEFIPQTDWYQLETGVNEDLIEQVESDAYVIRHAHSGGYDMVELLIPYDWTTIAAGAPIDARVHLYGGEVVGDLDIFEAAVSDLNVLPMPEQPDVETVLAAHTFLEQTDDMTLWAKPGNWNVSGDLVLPDGFSLNIPAGTTLAFEQDAILFANAPIDIYGEESAAVTLTAQDESWSGVVTLEAGELSTWQYAVVEKTTGIARDGWILTGGITFYESPLNLRNSVIRNSLGEDGLNVIRSQFRFEQSVFSNIFSDAFDGDFTEGEIIQCRFVDVAGDAIDVSGSHVEVIDTTTLRVLDKGVSAGEESTMILRNLTIEDVGIGIASKDRSVVTVYDTTIRGAKFSGLAAYIKKPVYGPSRIEAVGVTVEESEQQAIAQSRCNLILNGEAIDTVDMDVDLLYQQGILGN